MKIVEVLDAYGHENVRSTHKTTLEVTKENVLTKRGDCIIAVGSTKGAADLSSAFKEAMKREDAQLTVVIEAGGMREVVRAWGSSRLSFLHPTDLVIRKSDYVCNRTVGIRADKAACDLSRSFIRKIQNHNEKIRISLTVEDR
ncbi:MAG: DUF371 domain-containing protein [Candidatus Bathyarchaeia archaeon]